MRQPAVRQQHTLTGMHFPISWSRTSLKLTSFGAMQVTSGRENEIDFQTRGCRMRLVRNAKTLSNKAIYSMRMAMSQFNSYADEGRVCSILLHLQHACEMLLKAVLVQKRARVFDEKSGRSIGFERALNLCRTTYGLRAQPEMS